MSQFEGRAATPSGSVSGSGSGFSPGYGARWRAMLGAMTTTLQAPSRPARLAAFVAAAWALGFAAVNLYLQFRGIDDPRVQRSWAAFTVVNLGVTALKIAGAAVALATVLPWAVPHRLVTAAAWAAATLLLLYAGIGAVLVTAQGGWTYSVVAGGTFAVPVWAYLLFFLVPGACFAVAATDHLRRAGTPLRWALLGAAGAPVVLGAVVLALSTAVN